MNPEINKIREKINEIDKNILKLLNERASLSKKIVDIKIKKNLPVCDPEREKNIIETLKKLNEGPLKHRDVEEVITAIIKVCKNLQHLVKNSGDKNG